MSEQDMTQDLPSVDIQPFEVSDANVSFPAGKYLFVLGGIKAVYPKEGDSQEPEAVTNDLWVIKFLGNPDDAIKPHTRITFKDGTPILDSVKGVKIVERYPNPKLMPKMSWRAKAFYSKFPTAIEEITLASFDSNGDAKKKKVVVWKNIQRMYGLVFEASLVYKPNKDSSRTYRNFDYQTINPTESKVPADDMKKIEELYDELKKQDEVTPSSAPTAESALSGLPF